MNKFLTSGREKVDLLSDLLALTRDPAIQQQSLPSVRSDNTRAGGTAMDIHQKRSSNKREVERSVFDGWGEGQTNATPVSGTEGKRQGVGAVKGWKKVEGKLVYQTFRNGGLVRTEGRHAYIAAMGDGAVSKRHKTDNNNKDKGPVDRLRPELP